MIKCFLIYVLRAETFFNWFPKLTLKKKTMHFGLFSFYSTHATNPVLEDCMAGISAERDSICAGESIQLSATNDADIYEWSPANSIIGGTDQNPLVSPGITTTYTLTTTTLEDELIQNPHFESIHLLMW